LAITVIGGLTVSTFLTLFVIPCVYLIFKDFRLMRK
jgi:multidrug efflux pump subunit AcrB